MSISALAWYLALTIYALVRYTRSGDRRWLIVGATLMGMTLGIKHLGLVALAITATLLAFGEVRTATRGQAVTIGRGVRIDRARDGVAVVRPRVQSLR